MGQAWSAAFRKPCAPPLVAYVFGLDGSGKTTLLYKAKTGKLVHVTSPTNGFNVENLPMITPDGDHHGMTVWDYGGAANIRGVIGPTVLTNNQEGIVFVVDSSDRARMTEARDALHQLLGAVTFSGFVLMILANKQDLPGALSADEVASHLELDLLPSHTRIVRACSATNDRNVMPHFAALYEAMYAKLRHA